LTQIIEKLILFFFYNQQDIFNILMAKNFFPTLSDNSNLPNSTKTIFLLFSVFNAAGVGTGNSFQASESAKERGI
jgi:hypothetical protein